MGWHDQSRSWAYTGGATLWYDEEGDGLLPVQSWRPDENEAQHAEVLDRMCDLGFELEMTVSGERTRVRFRVGEEAVAEITGAERRLALLEAAVAACCKDPPGIGGAGGETGA